MQKLWRCPPTGQFPRCSEDPLVTVPARSAALCLSAVTWCYQSLTGTRTVLQNSCCCDSFERAPCSTGSRLVRRQHCRLCTHKDEQLLCSLFRDGRWSWICSQVRAVLPLLRCTWESEMAALTVRDFCIISINLFFIDEVLCNSLSLMSAEGRSPLVFLLFIPRGGPRKKKILDYGIYT